LICVAYRLRAYAFRLPRAHGLFHVYVYCHTPVAFYRCTRLPFYGCYALFTPLFFGSAGFCTRLQFGLVTPLPGSFTFRPYPVLRCCPFSLNSVDVMPITDSRLDFAVRSFGSVLYVYLQFTVHIHCAGYAFTLPGYVFWLVWLRAFVTRLFTCQLFYFCMPDRIAFGGGWFACPLRFVHITFSAHFGLRMVHHTRARLRLCRLCVRLRSSVLLRFVTATYSSLLHVLARYGYVLRLLITFFVQFAARAPLTFAFTHVPHYTFILRFTLPRAYAYVDLVFVAVCSSLPVYTTRLPDLRCGSPFPTRLYTPRSFRTHTFAFTLFLHCLHCILLHYVCSVACHYVYRRRYSVACSRFRVLYIYRCSVVATVATALPSCRVCLLLFFGCRHTWTFYSCRLLVYYLVT